MNQEEHHRTKIFKEEYIKMLTDFDIAFEIDICLSFMNDEKNAAPMGLSILNY